MADDKPPQDPLNVSMALPDPLRGSGRLFLWAPDSATFQSLHALASSAERAVQGVAGAEHCLAVEVHEDDVVGFLGQLRQDLSKEALEETRALFKPGQDEPNLSDVPRTDSLKTFIMFARGKWLGEILAERRLEVHFQPIVEADRPRQVWGHECLARARSRSHDLIGPLRMLSAARDAGLLSAFDMAVHDHGLKALAASGAPGEVLLNVTPSTVVDPIFGAEELKQVVERAGIAPERVIFEITESEKLTDELRMESWMREARERGFRVALDDLGAGFSNMNLIHRLRPDIVKLDMGLIRDIHSDAYKAVIAEKIIEIAQGLQIHTVAEGVEQEEELAWLAARGVDYVQGRLTGEPKELPKDTLDLESSQF